MADFFGTVQGNRGEASRCGSKNSGINSHIRSWSNDIYTDLSMDNETEKDLLNINFNFKDELKATINGIEVTEDTLNILKSEEFKAFAKSFKFTKDL